MPGIGGWVTERGAMMGEKLAKAREGNKYLGKVGMERLGNAGNRARGAGEWMGKHPYKTMGIGAVGYSMYRALPGGGSRRVGGGGTGSSSGSSGLLSRSTGGYA